MAWGQPTSAMSIGYHRFYRPFIVGNLQFSYIVHHLILSITSNQMPICVPSWVAPAVVPNISHSYQMGYHKFQGGALSSTSPEVGFGPEGLHFRRMVWPFKTKVLVQWTAMESSLNGDIQAIVELFRLDWCETIPNSTWKGCYIFWLPFAFG